MLKLLKYMSKKDWLLVIVCVGLIAFQVWLDLKIPDYMAEITMIIQTENSLMSDILLAGWKMLACALISLGSAIVVAIIASKIASDFSARLRSGIFGKVQSFSMQEISKFSTASLITRSTNDITQVQLLIVMGLQAIIKAPILATWAICKIAGKSWQWTLSTGIAVGVLIVVVGICVLIALPKFKKLQKLTDDLNMVTRENLNGISVVRAYNAEKYQSKKFENVNEELTQTNLFAGRVMSFLFPSIQGVISGLSLSIYWIGAVLIQNAIITDKAVLFADMVTFSAYAMQILLAFMMLIITFIMLPRALVSAKRINQVLKTNPSIIDGKVENDAEEKGEIEFKHISFKYPEAENYIIKNLDLKIHKGETVSFIGSTGCGKSTVINLILRFYDATNGEVLVDGINVKEYKLKALRNKIGYISQKAILFAGTVKSNVAFGKNEDANTEDSNIEDAIEIAQAKEFVENMENSYDANIIAGGSNLSGGQKQRLSIARAIYKNPEILIFDDSFSALDYKTDQKLRKVLKEKCKDVTKIIVAQRIGTILDADKIVVLDEGEVVGVGKHSDLLVDCEVYKEIAYSQLTKEELANETK